jgi:hypothetical protein
MKSELYLTEAEGNDLLSNQLLSDTFGKLCTDLTWFHSKQYIVSRALDGIYDALGGGTIEQMADQFNGFVFNKLTNPQTNIHQDIMRGVVMERCFLSSTEIANNTLSLICLFRMNESGFLPIKGDNGVIKDCIIHKSTWEAIRDSNPPEKPNQTTYTYFVLKDGFVKIGKSTDPTKRMEGLNVGSPTKLSPILVIPKNIEKELHVRFAKHRRHGEWFECVDEIKAYINRQAKVKKNRYYGE